MAYLPGKFVWFEHVSTDIPKARAFYEALCGWKVQAMPMGGQNYDLITLNNNGIGGFRTADKGTLAHWASYVSVTDVDKACKAAKTAGAQVLSEPMNYGEVGRGAVVKDPTGAMVSLWKGSQDDPVDVDKTPVGGWFWSELHTSDAAAAVKFYTKVLGCEHDQMDMGPGGNYHMLKDKGGKMRAGIMQQQAGMPMPSHWLVYVHVADCDTATKKAMKLGAKKTVVAPTDIPDVGRFSVILDPLGAPIGLIKGAG